MPKTLAERERSTIEYGNIRMKNGEDPLDYLGGGHPLVNRLMLLGESKPEEEINRQIVYHLSSLFCI